MAFYSSEKYLCPQCSGPLMLCITSKQKSYFDIADFDDRVAFLKIYEYAHLGKKEELSFLPEWNGDYGSGCRTVSLKCSCCGTQYEATLENIPWSSAELNTNRHWLKLKIGEIIPII